MGANRAAFKMLDVKIFKDLRNTANRVANCEMANIGKTVAASDMQMRAIEKIIESGKSDELPDELKQTLDLRAAFPGATLNELAEMHTPPITKSGVNHRLKRIVDFSMKL
jgi:DNA-binding protein WhiA